MKHYRIALMRGDGIGPELTDATLTVLQALESKLELSLDFVEVEGGDACQETRGIALPNDTIQEIRRSDVCLKGPVGETAADVIVRLRLILDLYANIRPIKTFAPSLGIRPDVDLLIVRENTEDVYKGLEFSVNDTALCLRVISRKSCERIAKKAFEMARKRNGRRKVTAVHKANVMKVTCGLFAQVCRETSLRYPEIAFEEQYVDAVAMRLIKSPQEFDVIVTTNMFGDILSDEAAEIAGGLGMAPGANIGDHHAIFEPIHGSAPDKAGKQTANPCSMILASKMMFDWLGERYDDLHCLKAASIIEKAVTQSLFKDVRVPDLGGTATTQEMARAIAEGIR